MASSGTYTFNPYNSDLVGSAFSRIQVRRVDLTAEHMRNAAHQANLLLVEWSTKGGPNLWKEELISQALTAGTATYVLPIRVITILLAYIQTGSNPANDRVIMPVSSTDYASFPDKTTRGIPTVYWLDRQITPQVTVWQPPDSTTPYTLKMRVFSRVQDANLPGGETLDIPYRFLDAFEAGLAHRLSRIYKPALESARKADAAEAWANAASNDTENVPLALVPGISVYFR